MPRWADEPVAEAAKSAKGEGGAGPISKLRNNNHRSLGPKWSMSKVGTLPPLIPNKPLGLVASNNNNNNNTKIQHKNKSLSFKIQAAPTMKTACARNYNF